MPELPEVEVIRRALSPHLVGRVIRTVRVWRRRLRRPVPVTDLRKHVMGRRIQTVRRRGKYLLVDLSGDTRLVLHLGMSGAFRITDATAPPDSYDCVEWGIGTGQAWRLSDVRRFSLVCVVAPDASGNDPTRGLGPEPLTDGFNLEYLARLGHGRRQPIKNLLLNQAAVAGIGNIYAGEALFAARVDPRRPAGSLSVTELQRIINAVKETLLSAIAAGGTTLRDFHLPDGTEGRFQLDLSVYGRQGCPCVRCRGDSTVSRIVQAGRSTFLCTSCQY